MNLNHLVNMFMRIVTRRAMNWGINKGIGKMSKSGRNSQRPRQGQPPHSGQSQKRIRQAMRMIRRSGR